MRVFTVLHWLLRVQVLLGVVEYIGLFAGFAWPPQVWAAHKMIALVVPVIALFAFHRSAWGRAGRPAPLLQPRVRVVARFALLAPLAIGLCFGTGVLFGRGWVTVHVVVAIGALAAIERAIADLRRRRATIAGGDGTPDRTPPVAARASLQTRGTTK